MTLHEPPTLPNPEFNASAFIGNLNGALGQIDFALKVGEKTAGKGIKRLYFTGCGAPHFMMRVLEYWAKQYATSLDIRCFFSAELIHQDPRSLDTDTVVLLGSHSGNTKETVQAARFLKNTPCKTIAITQHASSPVGSAADEVIAYGETKEGYFSSYVLAQALVSRILQEIEPSWNLHTELLASLPYLPGALADAKIANLENAAVQAAEFGNGRIIYVIGAGPMFTTAYTLASCFLMEMQRMHAHPLVAAEFFHGPFEVVDHSTPLIILIGEDPNRPEAERVAAFCQTYAKRHIIYDSKNYAMKQIHASIRPLVAPFVLDSALTALVDQFAIVHNFPLTTRRYMGKVDY